MSFKDLQRICAMLLGIVQLTQCATVILYCKDDASLSNYDEVALSDAKMLLASPCFIHERETIYYAFGYGGKVNGTATVSVLKAIISTKTYNTILLNWEKEASSISISNYTDTITKQISYVITGVEEAVNIGTQLGLQLVEMEKAGLDLIQTYLIGHSLGAQLIGVAGRTVNASNITIGRIIGLDPAGPLFDKPTVLPTLSAGDAKAVFCVHTDPGDYGVNVTKCQIDYLVNYKYFTLPDEADRVQLGCPIGTFKKFSDDDLCSHNRSWMLFIESLQNLTLNLLASKADNVWDWERGIRNCSDSVALGIHWDTTKSGVYFVRTNSASLYGQGEAGACP